MLDIGYTKVFSMQIKDVTFYTSTDLCKPCKSVCVCAQIYLPSRNRHIKASTIKVAQCHVWTLLPSYTHRHCTLLT